MHALFEQGKYPVIDGLRAWAILLVLVTHLLQVIPGLSYVQWNMEILHPLFNGWIGVDLFFVLSGYLVGGQILSALEKNSFSFKKFYLRRAFRILPAYFACLLILILLQKAWPEAGLDWSSSSIAKNFFLLTDYLPANIGVASWSLSIEEKFYLICPLLLLLLNTCSKKKKMNFFIVISSLALIFRLLTYRYYSLSPEAPAEDILKHIYFPFHNRMDALAMGVVASLLTDQLTAASQKDLIASFFRKLGLVLVTSVAVLGALSGGLFETTLQYSLLASGFAMLLVGLRSGEGWSTRFLSHSLWTPIARLSYSIYLTHLAVIHGLAKMLQPQFDLSSFIQLFLIAAAVLVTSLALFFAIENPTHQWAKKKF